MCCNDCSYNIRAIFKNTKPHIFRIPKNQNITNTPSKCSDFSLSVKGLSNLNCLKERVGKSQQAAPL